MLLRVAVGMHTPPDLATWEQTEQERSAREASGLSPQPLAERIVRRYLNPPAGTAYPLEYAFHLLGDISNLHVLDFGCGAGENSVILARRNARVTAFDISHELLSHAKRICIGPKWFVGSAHQLPLPDASVDVVFGIMILHHLDLDLCAKEISRVLKPGGRAIFSEPVRTLKIIKVIRACIPYRAANVSPFERPLTNAEVTRFSSYFSRAHVRPFTLPLISLITILGLPGLTAAYRVDRWLLDRVPFLRDVAGVQVIEVVK